MASEEDELFEVAGILLRQQAIRSQMADWILARTPREHVVNLRRNSETVFKEYMEDAAAIINALDKVRAASK